VIRSTIISTSLFFLLVSLSAQAQTATIDGSKNYQTMDGFGGPNGGCATWQLGNSLTSGQAALLFSTTPGTGIGISSYRSVTCDGNPINSLSIPTNPDLAAMQAATSYGVPITLSIFPPCSGSGGNLKYSTAGSPNCFGDGTTGASGSCVANYTSYANWVVTDLQYLQSQGVTISVLDVVDEPGGPSNTFGDEFGICNFSAAAIDTWTKTLQPILATAGFTPKLMLASMYDYANSVNYFNTCATDSACNSLVSIYSGHGYGYPDTSAEYYPNVISQTAGKHFWMSETTSAGSCFNAAMADSACNYGALTMAENMDLFLSTAQVSNYMWYQPFYANNGGSNQSSQLVDQTNTPTKRYYAFGNYSLFVRPGDVAINATHSPQSGVTVTAFKTPSTGVIKIVAINSNSGSVPQLFSLSGLSAASVTPWITSSSLNLASQPPISISGGAFTYSLPAVSVTTFVGNGDSGPGVPTGLKSVAE
jgi:glucuronoarabinoxylan endo-1,4-beta-xylanase